MRGLLASSKKKPVHRQSHSARARSLVDRALSFGAPSDHQEEINKLLLESIPLAEWPDRLFTGGTDVNIMEPEVLIVEPESSGNVDVEM